MTSSFILGELISNEAYLTTDQFNQYILLDGKCHPDYVEQPLSARGAKLCTRIPGTTSFPNKITKPSTNAYSPRGMSSNRPDYTPRLGLWSDEPDWETRTDYPGMGYAPVEVGVMPKEYSQVSYWTGPLRRVPDQAYLVDNGYLRQRIAMDGIGFGSNHRNDRNDYLSNFDYPDGDPRLPKMPRKYNVTHLTQRYPLWKEATGSRDQVDLMNMRRVV